MKVHDIHARQILIKAILVACKRKLEAIEH
jgi:hypothetical protein